MRVVLVGSEPDRARLRARMNGSLTVVGEFASLGAATTRHAESGKTNDSPRADG